MREWVWDSSWKMGTLIIHDKWTASSQPRISIYNTHSQQPANNAKRLTWKDHDHASSQYSYERSPPRYFWFREPCAFRLWVIIVVVVYIYIYMFSWLQSNEWVSREWCMLYDVSEGRWKIGMVRSFEWEAHQISQLLILTLREGSARRRIASYIQQWTTACNWQITYSDLVRMAGFLIISFNDVFTLLRWISLALFGFTCGFVLRAVFWK